MASKSNLIYIVCDKMQIAKHIVSKYERSIVGTDPYRLERAISYYTGVDRNTIHEVVKNMKPRKTFRDWSSNRVNEHEVSIISFEEMRVVIIDQYVYKQKVPTKASLVEAIKGIQNSCKDYTALLLQLDLRTLGFIWKRLPKSNKYILVEKTEQFTRRMKYLQQMKEYRESNRVLVYIERTVPCSYNITQNRILCTEIVAVASPQLGTIDTYFPPKLQTLEFWLRNKLHTIPQNSVFVIEQSNRLSVDLKQTAKLPTMHSSKKDMIKWLEAYNIPHDPTFHRGELFTLIEKHKVNCPPLYKFCEVLKAAGHDVILRPPELTHLKYFKRVLKPVYNEKNMCLSEFEAYVIATMNNDLDYWVTEEKRMADSEQKIYEEDQKLELILDRLMESIKDERVCVSDFKDCEEDEFDIDFYDSVVCDAAPMSFRKLKPKPVTEKVLNERSFKPGPSMRGPSKPGPNLPGLSMPVLNMPGPSKPSSPMAGPSSR